MRAPQEAIAALESVKENQHSGAALREHVPPEARAAAVEPMQLDAPLDSVRAVQRRCPCDTRDGIADLSARGRLSRARR